MMQANKQTTTQHQHTLKYISTAQMAIEQKISAYSELFRFSYHVNFAIVVCGALPMLQYVSIGQFLINIAKTYICFGVLLIGGIYTVNALTDVDEDRRHPTKKYRPVPSGKVGQLEAFILAISSITTAIIWAWNDSLFGKRVVFIYFAFIFVNLSYSLGWRNTALRFAIAITSPMRLILGLFVACGAGKTDISWLPSRYYIFAFFMLGLVQTMRFRYERSGQLWNPVRTVDASLELLFSLTVMFGMMILALSTPATRFLDAFMVFSFSLFIVTPYLEPRTLPCILMYAAPPGCSWLEKPSPFVACARGGGGLRLVALTIFTWFNHMLMGVEELFYPQLRLYNGDNTWSKNDLVVQIENHTTTQTSITRAKSSSSSWSSMFSSCVAMLVNKNDERTMINGHEWLVGHFKTEVACEFMKIDDANVVWELDILDDFDYCFLARCLRRAVYVKKLKEKEEACLVRLDGLLLERLSKFAPGFRVMKESSKFVGYEMILPRFDVDDSANDTDDETDDGKKEN